MVVVVHHNALKLYTMVEHVANIKERRKKKERKEDSNYD